MENQEQTTVANDEMWRRMEKTHRRGKIAGGLLIVAIGSLFLAKEMGAQIPTWLFTWKMLLVAMGIAAAIKHKFLHPSWIILIGVGGAFLISDIYPDLHIHDYIWPLVIIMFGLIIIFKPRRRHTHYWKKWHQHHHHWHRHHWHKHQWQNQPWSKHPWYGAPTDEALNTDTEKDNNTGDDYIDSTSIMGGIKKIILSKKFKGGDVVNIFGGANINLSQADFEGTATLDITQVFGGTKLIVPANWEIRSAETITICGGIEDKRPVQPDLSGEPKRVLILIGTTIFGGIEIKSF